MERHVAQSQKGLLNRIIFLVMNWSFFIEIKFIAIVKRINVLSFVNNENENNPQIHYFNCYVPENSIPQF